MLSPQSLTKTRGVIITSSPFLSSVSHQQLPLLHPTNNSSSMDRSYSLRVLSSSLLVLVLVAALLVTTTTLSTTTSGSIFLSSPYSSSSSLLLHFIQPAHALTTITTREYICDPCTVNDNIQLSVIAMMDDAKAASKSYALAYLNRAVLGQPIHVDAATGIWSAADTTTYMNVTIIDTTFNSASYPAQYAVKVSGIFKQGSFVSIQGGSFELTGASGNAYVILLQSSLNLENARVSIVGTNLVNIGAFKTSGPLSLNNAAVYFEDSSVSMSTTSGSESTMVSFAGIIQLSERSNMSISNNSVLTFPRGHQSIITFSGSILVSSLSSLAISFNDVNVTYKYWPSGERLVKFVSMDYSSGNSISVTGASTSCSILDNKMRVLSEVTSVEKLDVQLLRAIDVSVTTTSTFYILRNELVLDTSIDHSGTVIQLLVSTFRDVSIAGTGSSMRVLSNRVEFGGSSIVLNSFAWAAIVQARDASIGTSSTLEVANSAMEVVPIAVVQTRTVLFMVMTFGEIQVKTGANIIVSGNSVTQQLGTDNIPTSATWLRSSNIDISSGPASTFKIEYNTISLQHHVPNVTESFYFPVGTMGTLQIDGSSTLRVAHNRVEYANVRTEPTGSTDGRSVALHYIRDNSVLSSGAYLQILNNTVEVGHAEMNAESTLILYLFRGADFNVFASQLEIKNNSMSLRDGVVNSAQRTFLFFMVNGGKIDLRTGGSFTYSNCQSSLSLTHVAGNVSVYSVLWVDTVSSGTTTTPIKFEDNINLLNVTSPAYALDSNINFPGVASLWKTDLDTTTVSIARNIITLLLDFTDTRATSTTVLAAVATLASNIALSNTQIVAKNNVMNVTVFNDADGTRTTLDIVAGLDLKDQSTTGPINIDGSSYISISSTQLTVTAPTFKSISLLRFQNTMAVYAGTVHSIVGCVMDVHTAVPPTPSLRPQEVHMLSSFKPFSGLQFNVRSNELTFPSSPQSSVAWVAQLATNTRTSIHTCNNQKNSQRCSVHRGSREYICVDSPGTPGASVEDCSTYSPTKSHLLTDSRLISKTDSIPHTSTRTMTIQATRSSSPFKSSSSLSSTISGIHTPTHTSSVQNTNTVERTASPYPDSTTTSPSQTSTIHTPSHASSTKTPTPPPTTSASLSRSVSISHQPSYTLSNERTDTASYTTTATQSHNSQSTSGTQTVSTSMTVLVTQSVSPTHPSPTPSHPTPSPSRSTTLRDYCLAIPSCMSKGTAIVRAKTHTNITDIDLQQNTTSQCIAPQANIGFGLWSTSGALVVVTLSEEASLGATPRPRSYNSVVWKRAGPTQSAVEYAIIEVGISTSITTPTSTPPPTGAWCVVAVRYVGTASLTGTTVTAQLPMSEILGCSRVDTPGASAVGLLSLTLADSPPLPPNVGVVADTGVVITSATGAVGGVTAGIVQSGIANAMVGMLRCSEFDAEAEVDFVSNPGGWAVGRSALQYQRGSLLLVLILMSSVVFVAGCVVCVMYARGEKAAGIMVAFGEARLPSLLVVPVLVSSSMALPSGTTVLLYGDSSGMDYFLALVVMVPLWAYLLLYAYRSTYGMRVGLEIIPMEVGGRKTYEPLWKRVLFFLMEPTYGPVVPTVRAQNFVADLDDDDGVLVVGAHEDPDAPEPWLRRNYFFVADRSWAGYGGVEAIVGSLVDMLEGIPLTTRSVSVCVARPAAMCALLVVLMLLLVFKWPNSVRFQQYSALSVTSLLLVANVLVVVNAVVVAPDLESAAGQLIGAVSLTIVALSMLDLLATLASIVPALRRSMGISGSSLTASISRLRSAVARTKRQASEDRDRRLAMAAIAVTDTPHLLHISASSDDDGAQDLQRYSKSRSHGDDDEDEYNRPTVADDITFTPREKSSSSAVRHQNYEPPTLTNALPRSTTTSTSRNASNVVLFRKHASTLYGKYQGLGDTAAFEEELELMKTPAEIESERMKHFTEEVMRDL